MRLNSKGRDSPSALAREEVAFPDISSILKSKWIKSKGKTNFTSTVYPSQGCFFQFVSKGCIHYSLLSKKICYEQFEEVYSDFTLHVSPSQSSRDASEVMSHLQ